MNQISQQTLQEFIDCPFFIPDRKQKNLKYEDRYQSYKKSNKIRVEATMELDKSYFVHLKIPSESQKGFSYYDVVIQFFTPNKDVEKELSIKNYYVQFFSNSPGFIYRYAALYKLHGYLIDSLLDKFSPGILETLPDKVNKEYELYFDSSIYYACRYILDNKLNFFGKLNFKLYKKKSPSAFFAGIQDNEDVEISRSLASVERQVRKEIKNEVKQDNAFNRRIRTAKSTYNHNKKSSIVVKKARKNTGSVKSSIIKRAKKSTMKNFK